MFYSTRTKKYKTIDLKVLVIMLLAALLVSCSHGNTPAAGAGEIKINLIADNDVNPNEQGHPAPLNLFIYGVRDQDVFSNAGLFDIVGKENNSLQGAASKLYEAILRPGEVRTIFIRPDDSSRALGFIGAYRNINDSTWQASWDLFKKKKSWWRRIFSDSAPELEIHLRRSAVTINKMD